MPLRGYIYFFFLEERGYDGPWLRGSRRLVLGFVGGGWQRRF